MTRSQPPVTVLVIGAGSRGRTYADYLRRHPQEGRVVGIAEPEAARRAHFAQLHGLSPEAVHASWHDALNAPRRADAVFITTPDHLHVAPAQRAAERGYHILLEKPMAPTEAECRAIVEAVTRAGVIFGVCHVLRYTPHTRALKRLLASGAVGEIVSLQHLEPVGFWHQAHSYVRGHWRKEAQSSPMLLAKSCHDLDWLRYVVGQPCERVSSFGSLKHFRRENQPPGAADRCVTCPPEVEQACPYSATRLYLGQVAAGGTGWPVNVLTERPTVETVTAALRNGPYGRCVYACDNDVVDHQVVNLEFAGGITASFTMTGFNRMRGRETHIFGTRGELVTDSRTIQIYDFLTERTQTIDTAAEEGTYDLSTHGGGDDGLVRAFLAAVAAGDPSLILSGPLETLESHTMVFAAERSRREGQVASLL
ncbi:Gfo/Idh/MocA family oxidoreductase [Deinococcus sp. KSM4-11]|uniref:Gfo/Idh/MocA family protein n=1 Tax=Deinococcus sp. KSM4-11 TaxID=2568654 RepID=UPI0010A2FA8A|nr:Gfo/Idh/MocA family oxidoreductase [Deinococcus sp. KSM4-11]THF86760.1 Gfo/Idh/MocA family oxidoreductase [Deinococcus sp. KSM4-11]